MMNYMCTLVIRREQSKEQSQAVTPTSGLVLGGWEQTGPGGSVGPQEGGDQHVGAAPHSSRTTAASTTFTRKRS